MSTGVLAPAQVSALAELLATPDGGIASRVLAKTGGGNVTLFAFDADQGLSEHTTPFDALVVVLAGELTLTIGGTAMTAGAGTVTRLPASVPHAVDARTAARMLLIMLREPKA